jgi:hypothetical protein
MLRFFTLALLICASVSAGTDTGKFEGVWKAEVRGRVYAILTILSDHPPRGTLARGSAEADAAMGLYIQDPKIIKGVLHFKTIDPNDGVVSYEMKVTAPAEAALSISGAEPLALKRY